MEDEVYIHKEWLDTQTPQVCVSIAYRAAMRVLPLALEVSRTDASERLALETLRKAQIAGVGAERPTPEIIAAASSVPIFESIAESIANAAMRAVSLAADTVERFDDADAVSQYAAYTTDGAGSAARRAVGNSDHAAAAVLACTTADIESLAEHGSLDGIAIVRPDDLEAAIPQYLAGGRSALNEGGPWTFWAEWYDRAMAGDPLNWDLKERIALIPNDIWEAGPEEVAKEIARIRALFAVRWKIEEVESASDLITEKRLGIGGNNPPEPIEPSPQDAEQVLLIGGAVRALLDETHASEVNPDKIQEAITVLDDGYWYLEAKNYSPAEVIGLSIAANAGFGLINWLLNPVNIQLLISLAQDWLKVLI